MTRWTDKIGAFLLDIVFPNRCPFCSGFIPWDAYVCPDCADRLRDANSQICRRCGYRDCICHDEDEEIVYDMVLAPYFFHDETVGEAIYRFKKIGDTNIANAAAENIVRYMESEKIPKPDIIVPVPMEKRKQTKRGHNQAELFARCIGKLLDVPVDSRLLFKRKGGEQHLLDREERIQHARELFYAGSAVLDGKTVMLCDDVMTTGSTINVCAGLLKKLGAAKVITAVCAVTELEDTSENTSEEEEA
ncbi:MAG: ComF family protein [Oscillospiraceae bacterium]|nr:ComF family protein [Oscillospiraceae bacterium]